jgi:hypothetical protein
MKIERSLFQISISETVLLSLFYLIVINAFVLLIAVIAEKSYFTLIQRSWIMMVIYPLVLPILQTAVNRNGVLSVKGLNDLTEPLKKIDTLLVTKSYTIVDQINGEFHYAKKKKFDQFFNFILKDDVRLKTLENELQVFGKKNMLMSIEFKLKY